MKSILLAASIAVTTIPLSADSPPGAPRKGGDTPGKVVCDRAGAKAEAENPGPRAEADRPGPRAEADSPGPRAEADRPGPRAEGDRPGPKAEGDRPGPRAEEKRGAAKGPKDAPAVPLRANGVYYIGNVPKATTLRLQPNESVSFKLEENPSTGFRWNIRHDKNVEVKTSFKGKDSGASAGAPGLLTVTVKRLTDKPTTLAFDYMRSWEKDDPFRRMTLTLE